MEVRLTVEIIRVPLAERHERGLAAEGALVA